MNIKEKYSIQEIQELYATLFGKLADPQMPQKDIVEQVIKHITNNATTVSVFTVPHNGFNVMYNTDKGVQYIAITGRRILYCNNKN